MYDIFIRAIKTAYQAGIAYVATAAATDLFILDWWVAGVVVIGGAFISALDNSARMLATKE